MAISGQRSAGYLPIQSGSAVASAPHGPGRRLEQQNRADSHSSDAVGDDGVVGGVELAKEVE